MLRGYRLQIKPNVNFSTGLEYSKFTGLEYNKLTTRLENLYGGTQGMREEDRNQVTTLNIRLDPL
jgi:hypothetical protein